MCGILCYGLDKHNKISFFRYKYKPEQSIVKQVLFQNHLHSVCLMMALKLNKNKTETLQFQTFLVFDLSVEFTTCIA